MGFPKTMKQRSLVVISYLGARHRSLRIDECGDGVELINNSISLWVKEIVSRLLEEEEKLEWWFEQDIDKEEERFEGDKDGGEV
ncbi:hypothetical protein Tco_0157600 [Tanacetum coccineum]